MSLDDRVPPNTGQGWRSPRAERVREEREDARSGMSRRRLIRSVGFGVAAVGFAGGAVAGGAILRNRLTSREVTAVESIAPAPVATGPSLPKPSEQIGVVTAVPDPVVAAPNTENAASRIESPPVVESPADRGIIDEPAVKVAYDPPAIGVAEAPVEPAPTGLTPLFPDYTLPRESRLLIPAIGIDAAVRPFGVDEFGRMEAPDRPEEVGWFDLGPLPGTAGNAILTGHLDWYDGSLGVFANLKSLKRDDMIEFADPRGTLATYRVLWQRSYVADKAPISEIIGQNLNLREMTLITCDGTFDQAARNYTRRLIVRCEVA